MGWYSDFIDSSNEKNAARSAIRRERYMGGKVKKEVLTSREALLEAALKAAEDIIGWYESEGDRSCHDDEEVPEDLRELEKALEAAKARLAK